MSGRGRQLAELKQHWAGLAAVTLAVGVGAALFSYTATFFVLPLQEASGWSRGEVAAGITMFMFGNALAMPLAGRLTDRLGVRPVGSIALTAYGALCLALAFLPLSLMGYYAILLTMGLICSGTSGVVFGPYVAQRFEHARGTALAIMMSGTALILIPFNRLLVELIDWGSWRAGYVALGLAALLVGLPLTLLATRSERRRREARQGSEVGARLLEAMRSSVYWKIIFGVIFSTLALGGFLNQLSPLLVDRGLSSETSAWLMSFFVLMVLIGRIASGALLDVFPPRFVAAGIMTAAALGLLPLLMDQPSVWMCAAAICLMGAAMGAEGDLQAFLLARHFGLRNFAALFGTSAMCTSACLGLGALLFGTIYDRTGGYDLAIIIAALLFLSAAASFFGIRDGVRGSWQADAD